MKVRTIKDVHLREGAPSTSARKKGVIYENMILDLEPVDGETHEGVSQWYRDKNGDFIWGGGVTTITEGLNAITVDDDDQTKWRLPPEQIDWRKRVLNLDESWTASGGEGVKIAVLDSGLDFDHPSLKHVDASNTFTFANLPIEDDHPKSHGTHCTGIIAAHRISRRGVIGVAPKATLLIGRVFDANHRKKEEAVVDGIDWAIGQHVQVISLCLGFAYKVPNVEAAIGRAVKAKIIVVASAGNNTELNGDPIDYPAGSKECMGVGAANQKFVEENRKTKFVDTLDYVLPYQKMWSCVRCSDKYFDEYAGCSESTTLMGGIAALSLIRLGIVADRPNDYFTLVQKDIDAIAVPMNESNHVDEPVLRIMKPRYSGD